MTDDRVLVIGAGVSGLACAFDLARAGRDVALVDERDRPGGVVGTVEDGGYRFETGPNTVQASAVAFRHLCGDAGIADRLVVSRPEAKLRYLFHRGRLRPLPLGPLQFLASGLLSVRGKLRALSEPLRRHERLATDEPEPTFEEFLARRIGREATRTLAGAFVRGVYAAEIGELGARSAFPRMWRLANEHGGLVRGMLASRKTRGASDWLPGPEVRRTALLSFPRGLRELPEALAAELGARLHLSTRVERLERTSAGFTATVTGGEALRAQTLVLAIPAPAAHRLLAPLATESGLDLGALAGIAHASVTLCHLGLASGAVLPPGFGFLVPPDESARPGAPLALGTLFPSNLFEGRAPEGAASVSSFYRTDAVRGLEDAELVERARADLSAALRCEAPAVHVSRIERWNDVIPRYSAGHSDRVRRFEAQLRAALPGVELAGSYLGGVSVDECIGHGRAVAKRLCATLLAGSAT